MPYSSKGFYWSKIFFCLSQIFVLRSGCANLQFCSKFCFFFLRQNLYPIFSPKIVCLKWRPAVCQINWSMNFKILDMFDQIWVGKGKFGAIFRRRFGCCCVGDSFRSKEISTFVFFYEPLFNERFLFIINFKMTQFILFFFTRFGNELFSGLIKSIFWHV